MPDARPPAAGAAGEAARLGAEAAPERRRRPDARRGQSVRRKPDRRKLRVDESPTLPGTEINAEDDLGLEDFQLLPQVELTLLPGERHLVRLSAFAMHRSADKRIEKDDLVRQRGLCRRRARRQPAEHDDVRPDVRLSLPGASARRAHRDVRHPDRRRRSERSGTQSRGARKRERRCAAAADRRRRSLRFHAALGGGSARAIPDGGM